MTTAVAMPSIQSSIHQHPSPSLPIALAPAPARKIQMPSLAKEISVTGKPTSSDAPISNVRSRRERPCDACRRRKSRCVLHEGAALCVLCEFHKQECTFVQSPLPRKRKVVEGDRKDPPNTKKRSVEADPPPLALSTPKISAPASIVPPALSQQPPPANLKLPQLGETLGLQRRQHSRYIGLSSPFDSLLIGLSQFDTRNESAFDLGTLRRVNDRECFIMLPDENTLDYAGEADTLDLIEQLVHPHGPALLDLYFQVVHPSYPIIQKHLFIERYRSSDRCFAPALLAGMYTLALNWWSLNPELARCSKPDVASLEAIAMRALTTAMERPKLSTVQAGLLLLQRPEIDSWSLTTQLVAIGQELGLHLDCTTWSVPRWEHGLRKRIAWALYMQDKWSSLIHGRPSHILDANWAVKPITEEDSNEETGGSDTRHCHEETEEERQENHTGRILFVQMISLTRIMAEVMDTFYTQTAIHDFANAGGNATELILARAKPVQIKLRQWHERLPAEVKMQAPEKGKLSSTGYLHLAYFATEITLHRRIIQSLDGTAPDSYGLFMCRNAAKTRLISAMDFVNRLTHEHLQAFWYFASKVNFTLIGTFGSLLWATAPAKEEAEFYKLRLREYRWTLSVSSKRADFLAYAVSMLDTSRAMLNNLAEKPSLAEQISVVGVPPAPPPRQYSSFSNIGPRPQPPNEQYDNEDVDMDDENELHRVSSGESFEGYNDESQYGSQPASRPHTAGNSP